jgi:hypothetical protein
MNKTITCEVTDELIRRSFRRSLGLTNFFKLIMVYAVLGVGAGRVAFTFSDEAGEIALLALAGLALPLGLYCRYAVLRGRRSVLAGMATLPHRLQGVTFTDDHVLVESAVGRAQLTWDRLEKIERFHDLWHLWFLSGYRVLPAEVIDEELASFLEAKARQRGVKFYREGRPAMSPALARARWVVLLLICCVVGVVWFALPHGASRDAVDERFVVEPDRPKLFPLAVRQGDSFDLSLAVTSGAPVDVWVAQGAILDDKQVVLKGAGLFEAEQVRTFQRIERWPHPRPAIITVTSTGRSEVTLKIEVRPAP